MCSFEHAKKRETSSFRKNEEQDILVKEIQSSEISVKDVDFESETKVARSENSSTVLYLQRDDFPGASTL